MLLFHFSHGRAFGIERTRGTDLDTFAATGAAIAAAPGLVKVDDDLAVNAPPHHVPCMRSLYLVTDAYAAGA